MRGINGLFILIVLIGCTKQSNFSSIEVVGHAGMGLSMGNSMYHDNSKEAIEFALQMRGCDGVEVDVQLSKDGNLWLYHDTKLEAESTGDGCISDKFNSELALMNYKTWRKEKLIPLSDLNPTLFIGKTLYLDLRTVNECSNQVINSAQLIHELNNLNLLHMPEVKVILVTNNVGVANQLMDSFYLVYLDVTGYQMAQQLLLENPVLQGIVIRNSAISKEEVKMIKDMGKKVVLYDMRSAVGIRKALKKNPDSIMTDDLREAIIETN